MQNYLLTVTAIFLVFAVFTPDCKLKGLLKVGSLSMVLWSSYQVVMSLGLIAKIGIATGL